MPLLGPFSQGIYFAAIRFALIRWGAMVKVRVQEADG